MDWVIISAVITAIATFVLAFFNIIYVRLVRKMLISSNRPEIIVDYDWKIFMEGRASNNDDFHLFLYVKNVGRGAAYNVEFIYDKSYELPISPGAGTNRVLDDIKFLHDGISILEQGVEMKEYAFGGNTYKFKSLKQFFGEEKKHTNITVTYEDVGKVSYNQTLTIDFCRPDYT